jgi:hypothetical protein
VQEINPSPRHGKAEKNIAEDADPFGDIKTGIDKITNDHEDNTPDWDKDRFYDLGGNKIKEGIESLIDDGFDYREIIDFIKEVISGYRNQF